MTRDLGGSSAPGDGPPAPAHAGYASAHATRRWIAAYERLWRTPGAAGLGELFTEDASYSQAPYREPVVGLPAIAAMWEAEREGGADEVFAMTTEVVAVDGDTAVVRAFVTYGDPVTDEFRDLWVVRFAPDGRCAHFEEWPFAPAD